jgi:hypothetical protein
MTEAFPRGKRKSTPTPTTAPSSTEDYLFGSIEAPAKKKTKTKNVTVPQPNIISALPLGGGGVLPPTTSGGGKVTPAKIELLTFGKLAGGMKVLGVVREVKEEYAVVALPTMLVGFVRREKVSC